jgi:hypothetical protein
VGASGVGGRVFFVTIRGGRSANEFR